MKRAVTLCIVSLFFFATGCKVGEKKAIGTMEELETVVDSLEIEEKDDKNSEQTHVDKIDEELWNSDKAEKLKVLMSNWASNMEHEYKEYRKDQNIDFYETSLPKDVLTNQTNKYQAAIGELPITLNWSEDGIVSHDYALVSVYSDAETQLDLQKHVYFFTIQSDGTPTVLMTMQKKVDKTMYLHFSETESQELKEGFTNIVLGNE